MEVAGNSGSGCFSKVHAEVQAVWQVTASQPGFGVLGKLHHLARDFRRERSEAGCVNVRQDKKVAGGVRESIQADKAMRPHKEDSGLPLSVFGNYFGLFRPLYGA